MLPVADTSEFPFDGLALSLDFGDPGGNDGDVAVMFEQGPVSGEFGVALFELAAKVELASMVVTTPLGITPRREWLSVSS